ncbi:MAG: IS30 family transposase [bacterium]|nr:IS30 family transposase [bacterium]
MLTTTKELIMPKGYKHVTLNKRCQINALIATGQISKNKIAEQLGVHRSTITRELQRNSNKHRYRYNQADERAKQRRSQASKKPKKLTAPLKSQIKDLLCLGWSPEQISGRLKQENISISHESIYKWIWADKHTGGKLYKLLRRKGKKRKNRGDKYAGRGFIKNRIDIDERPKIVKEKSRIGDFELDTVLGKRGSRPVLVTAVDRASKYTIIKLSRDKTALNVSIAIVEGLSNFPHKIETLTHDNGKEFSEHEAVSNILGSKAYFAKPYHSWERGLNEHTNGLIREYFPKGMNFSKIIDNDVKKVETLLNLRPRKVLKYLTPFEVIHNTKLNLFNVALQS